MIEGDSMSSRLWRMTGDRIFFYGVKLLSAYPPLMRLVYPYRDMAYRVLFRARRNYFFKSFSKGKYRDSQVALIQAPGWGINTPPLSIASLTAYMRKHGFKVMPIDINTDMYRRNAGKYRDGWLVDVSNFWTNEAVVGNFIADNRDVLEKYVECIVKSGAKVIGFSIYNSSLSMSLHLAKGIKARAQDRVIVFGGPHASVFMAGRSIIEGNPEVDIIAQGEGEETLLEIVRRATAGDDLSGCPGTLSRRNGKAVEGPARELIKSLDSLPFPDFSDFDFSHYREPFKIPVSSSRGCVNRCIFCNERAYWKRYRSRSGESMFDEVEYQLKRHPGVFFLDFQDSLVNGNMKALEMFCDLLVENGIKVQWAGQAIIRKELTYDFFVKLKRSGCINLAYGLETASMSTLEKVGKVFTRGVDIDRVISDSYRARVGCSLNFMFGLPGETDEEAEENIEFLRRNAKKISSVNPSPAFCIICPGTPAYEHPEKYHVDLSKGPDYWESIDGSNNYLKRIGRFERFVATVHELGIPSVYSHPRLANKNEAIANYYFSTGEYEKSIPYYEDALKSDAGNRTYKERLNICYAYSENK